MKCLYSPLRRGKKTRIAWFSGTGSTKYVASRLSDALVKNGIQTESVEMRYDGVDPHEMSQVDFLFILFAVHASGAPDLVHHWLDKLPDGGHTKVVVLSVSGGGEVWPNTPCRNQVISILEKKAYNVVYERMLVMPCNVLFESNSDLLARIMQILPLKIKDILSDLENAVIRRSPFRVSQIIINPISAMERKGVKKSSRHFIVSDTCTRCGRCIKECPAGNIKRDNQGRPVFGDNCLMCLRCLYGCPVRSIAAPKYEKWFVKSYDMKDFEIYLKHVSIKSVDECCKGLIWIGVKKYLKYLDE